MNSAVKIWGPTNVCFLTGINNYGSCCRVALQVCFCLPRTCSLQMYSIKLHVNTRGHSRLGYFEWRLGHVTMIKTTRDKRQRCCDSCYFLLSPTCILYLHFVIYSHHQILPFANQLRVPPSFSSFPHIMQWQSSRSSRIRSSSSSPYSLLCYGMLGGTQPG